MARGRIPEDLAEPSRAMLEYAVKLTRTPGAMVEGDVARLREVGWNDQAIHDIAQVTAYYAFVNRMADGLGVELEPYWDEESTVLPREEFEEMRGRFDRK